MGVQWYDALAHAPYLKVCHLQEKRLNITHCLNGKLIEWDKEIQEGTEKEGK
jgi:hypothetical protein